MQILKDVIKCLSDSKMEDIKIYRTETITPFYDLVVNSTANNSRQLSAAVQRLRKMSAEKGYYLKGIEGLRGGYWALVDMRDILVNVFLPEERAKYDLDKLWKDLPQIDPETCL
ncbi:MAG: ribosome silencing factor [Bacilli bacterium]|jgi:ribosome-associated protein|nr:ribosome silencing factor [Acholeplasmataceae bacterium]